MKFYWYLILFLATYGLNAQNIFEEKFEGCSTTHFLMESDSISVRSVGPGVLEILAKNFDKEVVEKIKGDLSLQVLVDLQGNSCLLSIENKTNIATESLNIKEIIDNKLKWQKPPEKTSPILAIRFYGDAAEIIRMGLNGKKGFHELKGQP